MPNRPPEPSDGLRPAVADDAEVVAPLIYSSGPAAFDHVFGFRDASDASAFLERAFVGRSSQFSYRRHTVAVRAGSVVGVMASFTRDDLADSQLGTLVAIVRHFGLRGAWGVVRRGYRLERAMLHAPGSGRLYVAHVGVAPEARGRGVGEALLRHAEAEAARRELPRLCLDVARGNDVARRLYERLGLTVRESRSSPEPSIPDHLHMERELG